MVQIIMALLLSVNVYASPEKDAIKAQTGCYRVDFKFEETEKVDPDYPISSEPYHEWGTEWIEVDYESETEVHLQHVLLTPHGPLKHWRQEWVKNPLRWYSFKGNNTWVAGGYSKPVEDAWLQRVYQVDDSPRYECAASWVVTEKEAAWHCKTWSPLPRREFSKRSDYNILDRGNVVVVNSEGWTHHQFNDKILFKNDKATLIAREEGANTYTRLDDSICLEAKKWWAENKSVWNDIQAVWKEIYSSYDTLKLKASVDEKVLWMHLFELADRYALKTYDPKALRSETREVINKFIIN